MRFFRSFDKWLRIEFLCRHLYESPQFISLIEVAKHTGTQGFPGETIGQTIGEENQYAGWNT